MMELMECSSQSLGTSISAKCAQPQGEEEEQQCDF